MARLESAGIWAQDPTYAVWQMRQAFEKPQQAWERKYNVMAAAQWVLWNGQIFFKNILYSPPLSDDDRRSLAFGRRYKGSRDKHKGSRDKYKGSRDTLWLDRWHFWKDGFAEVAENGEYGNKCKDLASKARSLMDALEKSMLF
ncbi:hypothetical protein QBC46DRAFT_426230 [Diplogelasinospora grovesii]|uniref:Uncharacterized protein n=1 Tax=Diplogelasinospora grovesii TaxID=303347 RepID=A0AAN6S6N9_9PEZI|nr:hypothetical protein QBC46DRAFT_426230 [Diplogelasinospora grovesii]